MFAAILCRRKQLDLPHSFALLAKFEAGKPGESGSAQQRKITEASKKLEMKKLYQVLVVIDDFADTPQLHKPHGALDTLFIRGRHMQISTWASSQKLRLISAAVRVNMQFLCCWRLRNQHELDAVIEELSALLPKEQLYRLCEQATREPYSFLFVYYLKPRNECPSGSRK